jgi:integrative and conjugative element protein (TIGR02256 family)
MKESIHSVWRPPDGEYTVTIERPCFDAMQRLAREHYPREVGTSLVGGYSDDGYRAWVTGLAPLTPDSRGTRNTFYRGALGLREFFRGLFTSSRGRTHYVGDWHSHPDGPALPSPTDDHNALSIARDSKAQCPECLLVILGGNSTAPDLGVFVYSRKRGRIVLSAEPESVRDTSR